MPLPDDAERHYEALLARHLSFYDALRLRERRPRSAAQRQFQEVAWGKAAPVSEHEKAYVWHLTRLRIAPFREAPPPVDGDADGNDPGLRPVSGEVGAKWDRAYREYRGGREFF